MFLNLWDLQSVDAAVAVVGDTGADVVVVVADAGVDDDIYVINFRSGFGTGLILNETKLNFLRKFRFGMERMKVDWRRRGNWKPNIFSLLLFFRSNT